MKTARTRRPDDQGLFTPLVERAAEKVVEMSLNEKKIVVQALAEVLIEIAKTRRGSSNERED